MITYKPQNWHWIVNGDETKAWSSAKSEYVTECPKNAVTRIESEESLSDVLRPYGLIGPHVSPDDVRAEAQRRIVVLTGAADFSGCLVKQLNANMLANEISDIRFTRALTPEEEAIAGYLRNLASSIKAIRAASNTFGDKPPLDYRDDKHWPGAK